MGIKDDALLYRELRTFKEICAKGTVSRAADDNGMKQSNVSACIKALEDRLQKQLFSRVRGRMVITEAGKEILQHVNKFERIMYDINSYCQENRCVAGSVNLWTSDGLGSGFVSGCLSEFTLRYPNISLNLICSLERPTGEWADKIDIGVVYEDQGPEMRTVYKGKLKFGLFASQDYISVFEKPKNIQDLLNNHKICTRNNFADVWPRWKEMLESAKNVVATTNATSTLLSLVRDGNGISLHPIGAVNREKDLVLLSELNYTEEHDFWIVVRKDAVVRPEVKLLMEFIKESMMRL